MDEILQKLLQSELLSEETKAELSEQWTASVETFKNTVRAEVSDEVRLQLSEQWLVERDALVEKVDEFVSTALTSELTELKADIERFRDLEAEYAERLVEEKHRLATEVASELDQLVDKIDAFFEVRLSAEIKELAEDIEIVKQNEFGRSIYEAFAKTFATVHVDENSAAGKLKIAEAQLAEAKKALATADEERNRMVREAKMDKLLAPLSGKTREQMQIVLKNIETDRLEESYKFFIGRILKEGAEQSAQLKESAQEKRTTVVTGDAPAVEQPPVINEEVARVKRLAGLR